MDNKLSNGSNTDFKPYLSPLAVFALAVGSAIGWGSLIVTSKSYLSQAGPLGSFIGLMIGFVMMLMVASHYQFLAKRHPGEGGLYNYIKNIFGYDRAFLAAWFMFLTYIALFWANATSIPVFARYFLHSAFSFGYMYTVFGYEVYAGEVLVTLAVILIIALLCLRSKKATARTIIALVLIFTAGITVCFVAAMIGRDSAVYTMKPELIPDKNVISQISRIAFISPWAFIGFESVSFYTTEYNFKRKNIFKVLFVALVVITALYLFIIIMSVSVYPESCTSWLDYISRLDEFEGIEGLPAFYAAYRYLGNTGIYILMLSLISLVLSSLIGMMRAVSRLCHTVAVDGILPERFTKLNKRHVPVNAIILIVLISLPVPFLGRTAIGWIVDTTTIGATIIYGFATLAVFKASKEDNAKMNRIISGICVIILGIFMVYLMFPELFSDNTIASETYALMTVWSLLGLFFFNSVIRKDHARNFGKAIIVWIALLMFIILMTLTWVERLNESREAAVIETIQSYYDGTAEPELQTMTDEEFLAEESIKLHNADKTSVAIIILLFGMSIGVLIANYVSMRKWEKKATDERDYARTIAFRDPLTGVKSKHAYDEQELITDVQIRKGKCEDFAVIVCDVNGLKKINDTLGHKAGDQYICCACEMLCEYFKHSPVFRIGGDEFVVLVEGRDYETRFDILAEINAEIESNIGSDKVVASLGLSEYDPENDTSIHDVFKRADGLMYERKTQLKSMGAVTRD